MTPRRVLLLNYEYPPVGGGAGVAMRGLAVELASRGIGVDVVTSAWGQASRTGKTPGTEPGSPGVSIYRVRSWRRGLHDSGFRGAGTYLASATRLTRWLLKRHRHDVVHVYFSLPTGLLLPLAVPRSYPTVVSLRGSDVPGYDLTHRTLQQLHRLLLPVTRYIWRRAFRVVALSTSLGEKACRSDPSLTVCVIPNGVDTSLFRPGDRGGLVGGDGNFRCLSVARLTPRKGHLTLLEAFAQLGDASCVLDIAGAGELEPVLRESVSRLGLAGRVTFHGALDHDAVARLYQSADLFTLLPESESFGNAFAEALAAGLPIVATRAGAIPGLVEHGVNGLLVAPGDAVAAAWAIHALAGDPVRRLEMARRNRERAETELSWAGVADQYLAVYREAMAASAPPPRQLAPAQ